MAGQRLLIWFNDLRNKDVGLVGGKNASLGEMISQLKQEKIDVPDGFATTSYAYWQFLEHNNLKKAITDQLAKLKKTKAILPKSAKRSANFLPGPNFRPLSAPPFSMPINN